MAKQFNINYNNFMGGLNNRLAPHLLQPNEAQIAQNVNLRDGTLKPLNDLAASAISTFSSSLDYKWLWYAASSRWLGATQYRFALNDGSKTYYTVPGAAPRVHTTAGATLFQDFAMGISPINNYGWTLQTSGGQLKTGTYKYAITYETYDGLESNPQSVPLSMTYDADNWYMDFSGIVDSPDRRVVRKNFYRTELNQEVFYYVGSIDTGTLTFTDNFSDEQLDKTRPLTWSTGGNPTSGGTYVEDHGTPPALTVLSNSLHAANDAIGTSGAGILFGAAGSTVRWSQLGFPEYWPEVNYFDVTEEVEAIISWAGATYIFTANHIFSAYGNSDDAISIKKSAGSIGVYPGHGHLVKLTPFGVIYLAKEGLALFDGSNARIISSGKLARSFLDPTSKTFNATSFHDNKFYIFTSSETIVLDLVDYPNMMFSTSTHIVKSAANVNFLNAVYAEPLAQFPSIIEALYVHSPGMYTSMPTATISPAVNGVSTLRLTVEIDSVKITDGGAGYKNVPTVSTSGGNPKRPAKFQAFLLNDKVASIQVLDPGEGYTSVPTISLSPAPDPTGDPPQLNEAAVSLVVRLSSISLKSTLSTTSAASVGTTSYLNTSVSSATDNVYNNSVIINAANSRIDYISSYTGSTKAAVTNRQLVFSSGGKYQLILKPTLNTPPKVVITGNVASDGFAAGASANVRTYGYRDMGLVPILVGQSYFLYRLGGETVNTPYPGGVVTSFVHKYDIDKSSWSDVAASIHYNDGNNFFTANGSGGQPAVAIGSYIYTPQIKFIGNAVGGTARTLLSINTSTSTTTNTAYNVANGFLAMAADPTNNYVYILDTVPGLTRYTVSNGSVTSTASLSVGSFTTADGTNGGASMVYLNNKLYIIAGQSSQGVGTAGTSNIIIYNIADQTITRDDGANYGFTARSYQTAAVYNNRYILIHGGEYTDASGRLVYLSDLHIYDTQASGTKWIKSFPNVMNVGERSRHASTVVGTDWYIAGGSNTDNRYNDVMYRLPIEQMFDFSNVPGTYVTTAPAGGFVSVKKFEGGTAMASWIWRGRDEMAPDTGPLITWLRARLYALGNMTLKVRVNGAEPGSPFIKTITGAVASSVRRFWFPSNSTTRGQKLTLEVTGTSSTAEVTKIEIEAKQDGEV